MMTISPRKGSSACSDRRKQPAGDGASLTEENRCQIKRAFDLTPFFLGSQDSPNILPTSSHGTLTPVHLHINDFLPINAGHSSGFPEGLRRSLAPRRGK